MEAKVNWHYTCRNCGEIVQYGFAAGPAIGTCPDCKNKEPKKCVDCRKYETKDCSPWPVKGPNHWCTQYEVKPIKKIIYNKWGGKVE